MADPTQPESSDVAMSRVSETRRMYLAYIIWLSFVVFVIFVSMRPVQLPGDTLGIIIGGFMTFVGVVINYYFSTSMGSTVKSQIMGAMSKAQPSVTVTPDPAGTTTTTTKTEPPKP